MAIPGWNLLLSGAKWLWGKIKDRPTAQAGDAGVAIAGGGVGFYADRGGSAGHTVIHAQPGSSVNVYTGPKGERETPKRDWYAEAIELQRVNRHRDAINCFYKAMAATNDPQQHADFHVHIGNIFQGLSRFPEAEAHFRESIWILDEGAPGARP